MNFDLTQDQEKFRETIREFAIKEVLPIAAEIDENERFPRETINKMAKNNLMGIPYPLKYHGAGRDTLSYVLAIEEISRVCAATGDILSAHISLACHPIFQFGNKQQMDKYLIGMNEGTLLGAFGLTEPEAGTDSAAQTTTAVLRGSHYILNGSKIFITNGGEADVYIIFAMTDKSKGTKGISAFIVEKDFPGFIIGEKQNKMGIRGSITSRLYFQDCVVPKENLLLEEGKGFSIAMKTLDGGRIGIAAQALGIAQGAFDETVKYMKKRVQFGKPIASFQGLQWLVADMAVRIDAARLLVYKAACLKEENKPFSREAATAKLFASETAMKVTTLAVQIFGGRGYMKEYPIERMMRDAKITEIYEGTSQVQKMVIARDIFK
ncbi:MAG: acyl-CoA dehydrogenase [Christensenellales bacterium]|jgi:butyryl-CoA dehydrogenase